VGYALSEPLELRARGGTDVKWAPTVDHHRTVKLPLAGRTGLDAETAVERRGFYPAGGGAATLALSPAEPREVDLTGRGPLRSVTVASVASRSLEEPQVAERQARAALEALEARDPAAPDETSVGYAESDSPGSTVLVRAEYGDSLAGFDALGERGRPAEEVGGAAAEGFARFDQGAAAVDEHTADQLVLQLAVAGGEIAIPRVTDHVESNAEMVRAFGAEVRALDTGDGPPRIVSDGGLGVR
jgi:RNA 3'-terminal phosphate cyclase (ATP)